MSVGGPSVMPQGRASEWRGEKCAGLEARSMRRAVEVHENHDLQTETAASETFASRSEEVGEGPSDGRVVMTGSL